MSDTTPPGGATPPPPPGYGPASYGSAPGQGVDVVEAFKWGWKKFTENVSPILLAILGYVVAIAVVVVIWYVILAAVFLKTSDDIVIHDDGTVSMGSGPNFVAVLFVGALTTLVAVLLVSIMQAGFVQGALRLARGESLTPDAFFKFKNLPGVVLTSLLVAILTAVGYALFYLPGIAAALFLQFTLYYAIDRGLGPVDAVKASFELVKNNLATAGLTFLGLIVANAVGSLACGIGALVALPVGLLAQAYVYRRLTNEPVAA